jgi:hypothetical protein
MRDQRDQYIRSNAFTQFLISFHKKNKSLIKMSSNKKVKVATHVADLIKPRKKYFYPCYCVRCKGTEVDSRTQERHTKDKRL